MTVAGDRIQSQSPGGAAGKTAFPVPAKGYILALRSDLSIAPQFTPGTLLRVETNTISSNRNS